MTTKTDKADKIKERIAQRLDPKKIDESSIEFRIAEAVFDSIWPATPFSEADVKVQKYYLMEWAAALKIARPYLYHEVTNAVLEDAEAHHGIGSEVSRAVESSCERVMQGLDDDTDG